MSSSGYTYINDLEDRGTLGVVTRRQEQDHTPFTQLSEDVGGSYSNYDYLGESATSTVFDDDFGDVHAALALEDFVGVDGSNLVSEMLESNSSFDFGEAQPGTQTPSVASQQSISGADFDTLPIAPMAKRPIAAKPTPPISTSTAMLSGTQRPHSTNGPSTPSFSPLSVVTVAAPNAKGASLPYRNFEPYGVAGSPTAAGPYPGAGESVSNGGIARPTNSSANGGGGTLSTSRRATGKSNTAAASTRSVPSAPPPLQPVTSSSTNTTTAGGAAVTGTPERHEADLFNFGIETILHGNQFGFGRQPSFKRITTGATVPTSNTNRPLYLIPDLEAENFNTTTVAATSSTSRHITSARRGGAAGHGAAATTATAAPPADRNAEAFSTWLEALEPKVNSPANSARSARAASASVAPSSTAGPSVGEDFKREVDVMLKNLLGDYDLANLATVGLHGPNASVASGQPAVPNAPAGTRRGSLPTSSLSVTGGGKDALQRLEYDAFLNDVRNLVPVPQSPKGAKTTPSPSTPCASERRRLVPGRAATPSTSVTTPSSTNAVALNDGAEASGRRRRAWGGTVPPSRTTEAEGPNTGVPSALDVSAVKPNGGRLPVPPGTPSPSHRVPRTTPTSALVRRPEKTPTAVSDMDEDLLAAGYITSISLPHSVSPAARESTAPTTATAVPIHGRRFSSMEGHIGPSTAQLRHKWCSSVRAESSAASGPSTGGSPKRHQLPVKAAVIKTPAETPSSPNEKRTPEALRTSFETGASGKTNAGRRNASDGAGSTEDKTRLSTDFGLRDSGLPLPSFPYRPFVAIPELHRDSPTTRRSSAAQRDSFHKLNSGPVREGSGKGPRGQSANPVIAEPILIGERDRSSTLPRSGRSTDLRDDMDTSGGGAHGPYAGTPAQPRRRLNEFRGGDSALIASPSRSRASIGPVEDSRAEAARRQERERATQQANDERRERIQAFMARRKAEKQVEQMRRSQMLERDRQLEAFRAEQERQRICGATADLTSPMNGAAAAGATSRATSGTAAAAAGSGLNVIKAARRMRKPAATERPLRQLVATAGFIPATSTVAMSPESAAIAAPTTLPGTTVSSPDGRAGNVNTVLANKVKVRAVVVFISSGERQPSPPPPAAGEKAEDRKAASLLSCSSTGVFDGPAVEVEFNEARNLLKVRQPQEHSRSFPVDEFVRVTDASLAVVAKSTDRGEPVARWRTPTPLHGSSAVTAAPRRRLTSLTLTEMSRKFLAGVNVALLLGCTDSAQEASVLAIREVVEGVVSHMVGQSQLYASVAYVAGGNTEDLLDDAHHPIRSTFVSSPLFGPTLDNVGYMDVTGVGQLLRVIAEAYKRVRQTAHVEHGLIVISLLLKQRRGEDVVLSSYLLSDAGCDSNLYTAVLNKSQQAPFALFHSALGGPTLTTALVAVSAVDTTAVVPLLNVQHRLCTVMNKPCHIGSVRRFLELARRELEPADEGRSPPRRNSASVLSAAGKSGSINKMSASNRQQLQLQATTPSRPQMHRRLGEHVAALQAILDDPANYRPKAAPSSSEPEKSVPVLTSAPAAPSLPSTAPPSAATLPPTRLTALQMQEISRFDITAGKARRSIATPTPSSAAAATAGTAADVKKSTQTPPPRVGAGAMQLPSITHAPLFSMGKASLHGNPPISSKANPSLGQLPKKPITAAVPVKGAVAASSPLYPTRHAGGGTPDPTLKKSNGGRPSVASSRDSDNVLSQSKGEEALLTKQPRRTAQRLFPSPLPPPAVALSEQSVSDSAEYVRRGAGNSNDAGRRQTGFMNFEDVSSSQVSASGSKTLAAAAIGVCSAIQVPVSRTDGAAPNAGKRASGRGSLAASGCISPTKGTAQQRPASGKQPFTLPTMIGTSMPSKKLLPGATTIGSNGPQWPSAPALDIPMIPSIESIESSTTHDVSISMRQSSIAGDGERAPIPTSTKVRTLVLVDTRCRETSNVTYDNTMVIATTEDDFEEYDVDEVQEATPMQTTPLHSELLTELRDTLLMGCNAAMLGADSRPTGFSAMALKSVVHSVFEELNRDDAPRRGRLSASIVKVTGESVVDLLQDGGEVQKLIIAISPLFGSCVHGVTYADITSGAAFSESVDVALCRAAAGESGRDYGFLFCSLLFKLRLEEEKDVQVCSLVATFAGENVGLYTSVLDRSPLVPRALFHYALGGPSYTVALLGIGSEEARANQMLQVQRRLGEMSNRATHPGSVAKFVAGIRNDLTPNLIAKYGHSRDPSERAATKEMIERLAEMVKDADALLSDFDHHQPKAYLHGDADPAAASAPAPAGKELATPCSPNPASISSPKGAKTGSTTPDAASTRIAPSTTPAGASAAVGQGRSGEGVVPASASRTAAQNRALPSITAVNPDGDGERIQSLVCFEQVLMGAGTVAVQGNAVLCASQGGTRFDSDEVIVCDEAHRFLSSRLIDELVRKFLSGHHTGLLAADSSYSAFTPLMLRCIAANILEAVVGTSECSGAGTESSFVMTKPPTVSGELQVSIALIKDDVTADLLPIDVDSTYHRFEMEHNPLYGPRIVGVTPHHVASPQDFDHFLAVAIDNADPALQTADPGIMVVSLVLTQRAAAPTEDVLVSSLLCTAVFDAVHHYERVLEGAPGEPLDLFRTILRGPCFSVALLGLSDEEEDPGKLLRALNSLAQVRNRPPPVNSVLRHIRELQRGVVKLKERMTTSSNTDEKAYIQSHIEVAEQLLEEAEGLQRNTLTAMLPRTFVPLGVSPERRTPA